MAPTRSGNEMLKAQTGIATPQNPEAGIQAMLKAEVPRIQRLFQDPRMTTRFVQLAMMDIRKNSKLISAHPHSILGCMMQAASLGLYFGLNGQCYMVPYAGEATFITGWRGHVTLALRGNMGSEIRTGCVRPGDEFDFDDGSKPRIHHKRIGDRFLEPTHFWAAALQPGARNPVIDVWTTAEIKKHRDRFNKVGTKHYSFNNDESFEGYGRKVPLLQVIKYLPVCYESAVASELDYAADKGTQKIRPDDVEAGTIASAPQMPTRELPDSVMQKVALLGWSGETLASFLDANDSKTDADIELMIEAELDK